MNPYLFMAAVGVLCFTAGWLKGTRQHVAEHDLATWVRDDLVATPPAEEIPEFEVDDATMGRLLALLNSPLGTNQHGGGPSRSGVEGRCCVTMRACLNPVAKPWYRPR